MTTGSKLKAFRRNKGFSQEGLAENSGISIRTIQRIEKGFSEGSPFTLTTLAKALDIEAKELLPQGSLDQPDAENREWLKLMNLSALCVILIPLSNIFVPLLVFREYKDQAVVNKYGRKILSFHILWTVLTIILMIVVPIVLLLLFQPLNGGGVPLAVPVYLISVLLNVVVTIRIALTIDDKTNLMDRIPNIL